MNPSSQEGWSGMTIHVGDNTHVLPSYEDDRVHDTFVGGDCPCAPVDGGLVWGDRSPHEPPRRVWHHREGILKSGHK